MKRISSFLVVFSIILFCFSVFAESRVAVMPTMGRSNPEKRLAEDISKNVELLFSTIRGAVIVGERDVLSGAELRRLSTCNDTRCVLALTARKNVDYVIIPAIRLARGQGARLAVTLYDSSGKQIDRKMITAPDGSDAEDIAADMIGSIRTMVGSLPSGGGDTRTASSPAPARSRLSSYTDVKNEIAKGFQAYEKGDYAGAADIFNRAGNEMNCNCSQNDVGKALFNDVDRITKGLQRADEQMSAGDFRNALRTLEVVRKLDENVREQGFRNMVFKKERVVRHKYMMPNPEDSRTVENINKQFQTRIDDARKWRTKSFSEIDKQVNDRIQERDKKIAELKKSEKDVMKALSDAENGVKKKVQDMKYKWDQDDTELEQQIVQLENQITMIDQREKGVIKVTNKKREEARKKELDDLDKEFEDWKKAHQKAKDAYYEAQKKAEEDGSEATAKTIKDLQMKKAALEKKNKEFDAKLQKMIEDFDKAERKVDSQAMAVRMKGEDEDRKYSVQVEKEYQKKFDELNKKLAEYDSKESEMMKELEKFDREIEQFMMKSANEMGKIQEAIEKARTQTETKYAKVKELGQVKVEKDYENILNKLVGQKNKLEEAASRHQDQTETIKAKKEEELIKAHEAELQTIDKKLFAIENALAKLDQQHENKLARIQ
ncbi:MAG TPA: hypothetical protein ENN58_02920, partial [bacterium]|nr:hypothetical protein [bacterium]